MALGVVVSGSLMEMELLIVSGPVQYGAGSTGKGEAGICVRAWTTTTSAHAAATLALIQIQSAPRLLAQLWGFIQPSRSRVFSFSD